MNWSIERRINGEAVSEKSIFEEQKHNPQAEALLRRVMNRRENERA